MASKPRFEPGYIDGRRVSPQLHHPCSLRPLIRTILHVTKVFPVKVMKNEVSSHNNSENARDFLSFFLFFCVVVVVVFLTN